MATTAAPLKVSKSIEKNLVQAQTAAATTMEGEQSFVASTWAKATEKAKMAKTKTIQLVSDKTFQITAASAAGGAIACGTGGATVGLVGGGLIGGMVGVLPALLTFGLSIPAGAAIGGGCGAATGAVTGGSAGLVGGGAAGYGAYTRRAAIRSHASAHLAKVKAAYEGATTKAMAYKADAMKLVNAKVSLARAKVDNATAKVRSYLGLAQAKTTQTLAAAKAKTVEIASDKTVQVTTASAAGGAVALGAGGAATGLAAGGTIGAAIGVIPAIFTFGLSIPVGAAIGGGCGLVAGTAVGGSTGLVGGGLAGYGAFTKRGEIQSAAATAKARVKGATEYVKEKATESAEKVRARFVGGTGGTADMD